MKKSFIRVLTLSLALSSVGFISSCKDYDDDLRTEMNSQIAILDQKVDKEVQTDVKDLQEQLKALQEAMEKLKQCNCGVDKPWTSDLLAEVTKLNAKIDSKYAELDGKIGDKLDAAQVNAIVEALLPDLTKYYTKSEIDALLAGLNTGDDCNCDIETLKTKLASWVTSQITSTVTKDYVTALLTGEYASQAEFEDLKTKVDNITSVGCLCGDLATSISNLEKRIKNAEDRLTALDGEDGKIAQLFTLCEELKQYDATLLAKITTLEGQVQSLIQNSATKADVQVLKDLYNNLEPRVKALEDKIATLATKDELAAVQLKADMAYAQAEMNLEQIDLLLKNYYKMKTILNELGDNYQELSQKLSETIGNLQTLSEKHEADMELAAADRDAIRLLLNQKITAVQGQISTLTGDIEDLSAELAANVVDLNKKIFNNWSQIISTNEYIAEVEEALNERIDNIDELMAYYYTLINDIVNVEIANLNSRYDELSDKFGNYYTKEAIENRLVPIEIKLIDLDGELITLSEKVTQFQQQLQQQHTDDINMLQDRITDEILYHSNRLDDNVRALNERIDGLQDQINDLTDELNGVKQDVEALKKMITSIEIQSVKNSIFGTVNLPVGVQSNVLGLWYGEAEFGDVKFPAYRTGGVEEGGILFTPDPEKDPEGFNEYAKELRRVKDFVGDPRNGYYEKEQNEILMNESEGNAGKIYVTVNPSNVDFTGVKFAMVNSQDNENPFKLGELKPSNEKLTFGATRAANGFYEAPVTLSAGDAQRVNIKTANDIKAAISDVVKNVTSPAQINTGKLVNVIKDQMNNLRVDALGLKAEVESENRSVYSKYGIAAVSIKNPITYASFKDFNYVNVPGYEVANKFLNTLTDKAKGVFDGLLDGLTIPDAPDLKYIELQDFKIDPVTNELDPSLKAKFLITHTMTILDEVIAEDAVRYEIKEVNGEFIMQGPGIHDGERFIDWNFAQNGLEETIKVVDYTGNELHIAVTVTVEVDLQNEVEDLYKELVATINDQLGNVNNMLDKVEEVNQLVDALNNYVTDMNKMVEDLKASVNIDGLDDLTETLHNLVDNVNGKVVGLINRANSLLQPIMFATANGGSKLVSGAKSIPTAIGSATSFMLTNKLAEVVAPALKRHVAVTNVYKNGTAVANAKTLAEKVNNSGDMNKVIDGSQVRVSANGFEKGYVYEVTYTALDYKGQQVRNTFYVTRK